MLGNGDVSQAPGHPEANSGTPVFDDPSITLATCCINNEIPIQLVEKSGKLISVDPSVSFATFSLKSEVLVQLVAKSGRSTLVDRPLLWAYFDIQLPANEQGSVAAGVARF